MSTVPCSPPWTAGPGEELDAAEAVVGPAAAVLGRPPPELAGGDQHHAVGMTLLFQRREEGRHAGREVTEQALVIVDLRGVGIEAGRAHEQHACPDVEIDEIGSRVQTGRERTRRGGVRVVAFDRGVGAGLGQRVDRS